MKRAPNGEGFERVFDRVQQGEVVDGHRCQRCGRGFESESSATRKHLTRDGLECPGTTKEAT